MSDRDAATDPVDKAYVEAEALLGDEDARAARRARVLDAIAREPAAPVPDEAPPLRRSPWRRGGWLAAASVAVFCAFLAGRLYRPAVDRPQPPPAASALPPTAAAPAAPAAEPLTQPARPRPEPASRPAPAARSPNSLALAPAPPPAAAPQEVEAVPPPPSPPPPAPANVPLAAQAPAPAGDRVEEVVVTGSRVARRDFKAAAPVSAALAARPSAPPIPPDMASRGARLRAAAAHGRTAELESLLAGGLPVDIPDLHGTTALMKAIQAGQPAAAALLLRHGASLDQRNDAGASARDLAVEKHDPALDQALGLTADGDGASRLGSQ